MEKPLKMCMPVLRQMVNLSVGGLIRADSFQGTKMRKRTYLDTKGGQL